MIRRSWLIGVILAASLLGGVPHFTHAASDGLIVKCDTTIGPVPTLDANGKPIIDSVTGLPKTHDGFTDPCGVNSFIQQFVILSNYGLSIIVMLAMLMMVYGGFQFLTAAGRSSKIDEGKRIILGTIVGLIISMTAFVIVNFTIAAITGSGVAQRNINPFGAIAHVFSGDPTGLDRAFNSTGTGQGSTDCLSLSVGWDKDCTQIHCADSSPTVGVVHDLQKALNNKSCTDAAGTSLNVDGCFGPNTEAALRKFQVANDLPPTGQDDQTTQTLLGGGKTCTSEQALVDGVTKLLPTPQDSSASLTTTGCCVVADTSGSPAFCGNNVSERTCASVGGVNPSIGGNSLFYSGVTNCATDAQTRDVCGYCADPRSLQCFQTTTSHWCTDVVRDSTDPAFRMTFVPGRVAAGESACLRGWTDELLNLPP